jgi:hypothetical protein
VITSYTGLPYDFRRYNCWHHVCRVRADAGLSTPDFDVTAPLAKCSALFDAARAEPRGMQRVDNPADFDIVLLGSIAGGRLVWHAGAYYDSYVSHCSLAAGQVRLDTLADLRNDYTRVEFWR